MLKVYLFKETCFRELGDLSIRKQQSQGGRHGYWCYTRYLA